MKILILLFSVVTANMAWAFDPIIKSTDSTYHLVVSTDSIKAKIQETKQLIDNVKSEKELKKDEKKAADDRIAVLDALLLELQDRLSSLQAILLQPIPSALQ